MNKHLHRLIFNAARGQLMAVAESASSQGGGGHGPRRRKHVDTEPASFTLNPLALAVLLFVTGTIGLVDIAHAQIVGDPNAAANLRPSIGVAGNGVPLVNIQTPSAAGVSRNVYNQFDVQTNGVILNNATNNTQTQLAGWVTGNPNLVGGTARVILNEINANDPSTLRGYVEVAGDRAQVIIANPAGITCDGCGFINAQRATLTTGTPIMSGGNLDGYRVEGGQIRLEGAGLDSTGADYTDLIARSVDINAGLWANTLKITTGANQVDAAHTTATPITGSGAAPAYAIDVAQLGGMYAGKIHLIGTETGLGMRNAGTLGASVGEVVVSVDGTLTNSGQLSSTGDTRIDARGGIDNAGTLYAEGQVRLSTQGNISNSATIAAQGDATLLANGATSQISSTAGSLIAAGLTPNGTLTTTGSLNLSATAGQLINGQLAAGDSLSLHGSNLNLTGATIGGRSINLIATTGNLDASSARIVALDTLGASTQQTLRTDSAILIADQLNLQAGDLSNRSGELTQTGSGAMNLVTPSRIDNTDGIIASNAQNLTLTTGEIINTNGWIQHTGSGSLLVTVANNIDNTDGTLVSSTEATLNASQLINAGGFLGAGQDLHLTTGNLSGNGTVLAGRDGQIDVQGNYASGNQITANRNLSINATGSFTNQATVQAGNDLNIAASSIVNDNASHDSSLLAGGTLTTASSTFANNATVIAGSVSINASQSIINSGPQALIGATDSSGRLELLAPTIENRDDTTATDTVPQTTIIGLGDVVLAGGTDANGTYGAATQVLNQSALIQSSGDLVIRADTLTNTRRVLTAGTTYTNTGSTSGSVYWTSENPDVPGGRYVEPPHGGHWNSLYMGTDYTTTTARNSIEEISPEAQILVGGSFTPIVATLQNYWSKVNSQGDIALNGVSLDQDSWRGAQSLQERTTSSGVYNYRTYQYIPWTISWGPEITYVPVPAYAATFTANGSIGGSGNSINNPVGGTPANLPGILAPLPPNPTNILSLPTGGLYHLNTAPDSHYLVESNPAFANRTQWMGSDAYLNTLGYDPNLVQKRFGDNYYEQQLVLQQILALRGSALADGYADAQDQFETLYADGARLLQELKLPLGVSLSVDQIAALTHNVVILETREVDTPTGKQQVLVPIVYLAGIHAGELQADGPLIAADNIALIDSKAFTNQGKLLSRNALTVTMAKDATLNNTGGTLQAGGLLQLGTVNSDIDLTSARVKAGDLNIVSGKDLILSTASQERTTVSEVSTRTQTDLGRTASIEVTNNAAITTAGDFTQNGGQIAVGGDLVAEIGGDYTLGTVAKTDHLTADYRRSRGTAVTADITRTTQQTSSITVGGNATLAAGQDITAHGAKIDSGGDLTLYAGRNLTLDTANNTQKSDITSENDQPGLMGGPKAKGEIHEQSSERIGSVLTGKNITLLTGSTGILATRGADIRASEDLTLSAGAILLDATADTRQSSRSETGKKRQLSDQGSSVSAHGSILQAGNDLNLRSEGDTLITGSALAADNKLTLISGGNLTLQAAESSEYRQLNDYQKAKRRATTLSYQEDSVQKLLGTISVGNSLDIQVGGDFNADTPEKNPDGSFKADRMTAEGIVHGDSRQQVSITRTGLDASTNPTDSKVKGELKSQGIRNGAADDFTPKTSQSGSAALNQYINSGLVQIKNNPDLNAKIEHILKDTGGSSLTYKDDSGKISLTVAGQAKVQEVYNTLKLNETFDTQKITDQGTAQIVTLVVAIALTVCTAGAGAALVGAAQGTLAATMANAAFIGMVSTMTGQLAGGASFDDAFAAGVQAGATSALTAGVTYGVSDYLGLNPQYDASGNVIKDSAGKVQYATQYGAKYANMSALEKLGTSTWWTQASVNAITQGAIAEARGGKFEDGALGSVTTSLGSTLNSAVGDWAKQNDIANGDWSKVLLHSGIGALQAEATNQDALAGAIGGATAEVLSPLSTTLDTKTGNKLSSELLTLGTAILVNAAVNPNGSTSAMAAGNQALQTDRFNRQLHPEEQDLAKRLAAASKGKYTEAEIADALRWASNSERNETAQSNTLVDKTTDATLGNKPNDPVASTVLDPMIPGQTTTASQPYASNGNGTLVQNLSQVAKPSADLMSYVQQNTPNGTYSWDTGAWQNTAQPSYDSTRYATKSADGKTFTVPLAECPATGCANGGAIAWATTDKNDQKVLADYAAALDKETKRAVALTAGTPVMAAGIALGGVPVAGQIVVGAAIGSGVNLAAQSQLSEDGSIKISEVIMGGITGGLTMGRGWLPVVLINTGGAMNTSAWQNDNIEASMAGAAAGSVLGWGVGGLIESAGSKYISAVTKNTFWQYGNGFSSDMVPLSLGITGPVKGSGWPAKFGATGGAFVQEVSGDKIKKTVGGQP